MNILIGLALLFLLFVVIIATNVILTRKTRKNKTQSSSFRPQFNSENNLTDNDLINLLEEILVKKEKTIEMSTPLFELGFLDSMTMIQLATELEKKYYFEFETSDISLNNFKSGESIKALLTNKYKCISE